MKRTLTAIALLMTSTGIASAGSISCSGTVDYLSFHAPDTFMIRLSSMNTAVFFCKPETTFTVPGTTYTTGPQTCKALIALFTTAKVTGTEIAGMYFDGDDVPATCSGWGPWKSANIRHFSL